ncbi:hypothetical protein OsI_13034 [Oryza sativa Indica Group]|uniref:FMP27/BLTP2/Hobbit GFWDK motif-containing RBG unit domain-containing protein n=1 Tax=Oryza sativa subsp. indica TaxID=39946 RepID=B8API8_ORYSI|nr:hypothetical protein OsI_13034 [Oryza sativa Indica Group]
MASSPVKFFSVFLAVSVVGWVVFTFASRLLAWFLSRVLHASVGFRVAGFNCLRDVTIKFSKGSLESISIGEIKLSFRKSLVKLSFGFISKDPKLQLLINDLEIVTRSSQGKKLSKPGKSRSTGKGKCELFSGRCTCRGPKGYGRVPSGAVDIKELKVDTFKIAGPNHILGVKLHLVPLNLDAFQSDQISLANSEKVVAPFVCEDLFVTCDFGHEKNTQSQRVLVALKMVEMLPLDASAMNQTSKSKSILPSLKKQILAFPDKISFSVPKLDVKFTHLGEGLSVDNNIMGIHFTSAKTVPQDDLEEATPHFDVQIDLSEIHLVREGSSSLLEVLKVAAGASLDIPVDPFLPIRAEIDAKLGGTQCNLMLSRLMPWMRLHYLKSKGMKISKENSHRGISQTKEIKLIMWTCTVSAPEMSVMLYNLNGLVLYHICSQSSHLYANNIASKGIQIHTELGELQVHMQDEYKEFLKGNVFGVDTYSGSLMHIAREKRSTEAELERVKAIYEEDLSSSVKVTLLDMQNAKIVRRSGGLPDVPACSLFRATDINLRWEPDAHLAILETFIRIKYFLHNNKPINAEVGDIYENGPGSISTGPGKPQKSDKRGSIFAVDVEVLRVSAELADGVEANMHIQSIFTENIMIGVLSEGLCLSLNGARIMKSTRIQISCIPFGTSSLLDAKVESSSKRDWVVQGLDVHICMPYRLPLRAIEDAVEDMIRALKLISAAKKTMLFPDGKENPRKVKSGTTSFGSVKFVLRKLTAEIEEEPIQGWLDEHYHLMRNKVCELGVRLKFLEEAISGSVDPNNCSSKEKLLYDGIEVDMHDTAALQKLRDEIHKQAFQSYYTACQKMVHAEGSGACAEGFQAGFKPSSRRASLLSLSASELDVTLTRIDGGEVAMVEFIKGLDPVCQEKDIPFSRLYGSDIAVLAGSLVIQLRDYTSPLFSATSGQCQGRVILAQQATCFQPQIQQNVYVGRWHKVMMLRSASGTTPAIKMYSNLPIYFQRGEISFGVGYEPSFADISYAFQIALRRVNLSTRVKDSGPTNQPPKKERSLPWWDDMRYYIHGKIVLYFNETTWKFLATTNPYEKVDRLQIVSEYMEIQQTDGHVDVSAKEFKMYISSLASMMKNCTLKVPPGVPRPFIYAPFFSLNVVIDWQCESGNPLNHYLHALPIEGEPRKKVYDPFRSTYLSLRWNFSLKPLQVQYDNDALSPSYGNSSMQCGAISDNHSKLANVEFPTMNLGAHDLAWVFKWWSLNYSPPHKLRSFSRWPRYKIPRAARSGNLSLDKVLVEFFFRVDATPCCIRHATLTEDDATLTEDDPANGLTFKMSRLKYELCYSRGKQKYTFDCKRESLDLVYRGLDLYKPEVYIMRDINLSSAETVSNLKTNTQLGKVIHNKGNMGNFQDKHEDGFLLSCDYFTIRRQSRKADPARLMEWQDAGRNLEITYVRSEFENGSESDHTLSEPSDDDDGFNVVLADNCQRIFVYGLRLLWTIENRDAVWSWVGGISKAFEPPKPSPSRQYIQRKMIEQRHTTEGSKLTQDATSSVHVGSPSGQHVEALGSTSPLHSKANLSYDIAGKHGLFDDSDKGGNLQFMVNVIKPQFNLHSEEANGRFLLAAASGRVLARSFHSVVHVGKEMLEQALGASSIQIPELQPEMTWQRADYSVLLEDVQAHVAPTDVDPGAGLQWLPRILGSSEKLKRTGALLERVFMPCEMYFRYTRHKGGTADLKVKPLKELIFNSPNITATMTSRQFQVMLDVLTNLLFARLPKPRKNSLQYSSDDEDVEEEADEVVPDGVEEVELAKISLEQKERERKLLLDDIRSLMGTGNNHTSNFLSVERDDCLWMINSGKSLLVERLKRDLENLKKSRKSASSTLRKALQKAAQLRLMEKEKNKTPSCAKRISMKISKVVWSMIADGNTFAEAEISEMVFDFDRDYKDIGVGRFTTKCFEVEIHPLKIYLSETMYRMMWDYFFPEEDDSQRRQEVWRVSTSTGARRARRISTGADAVASTSYSVREHELPGRSELRRTSSFEMTLEESAVDSITNNNVVSLVNSNVSSRDTNNFMADNSVAAAEMFRSRTKDSKPTKSVRLSQDEKKVGKSHDEKRTRARKLIEFHDIKISQVKKFKAHNRETHDGAVPDHDLNLSDSDGDHHGKPDQFPVSWLKRPGEGAGDGFVTSIRGLFNSQRRKAKAFVLRTVRGDGDNECHDEWSDSDGEFPFARQLTITKKLLRRHTRKLRPRGQKNTGLTLQDSLPSSPRETTPYQSDSDSSSESPYEDFHE